MDRTIAVDHPASGSIFNCDICIAPRLVPSHAGSSNRIIFTWQNVGDHGFWNPIRHGYVQPLTDHQVTGGNRGSFFQECYKPLAVRKEHLKEVYRKKSCKIFSYVGRWLLLHSSPLTALRIISPLLPETDPHPPFHQVLNRWPDVSR